MLLLAFVSINESVGYLITALFGLAMIVIGNAIQVEGGGASLIIQLGSMLVNEIGLIGKWVFLIGAWAAIFSSLLGVWQSVPYLFADLWQLMWTPENSETQRIDSNSKLYRGYLYGLSIIPMLGLWIGFANMQKFYAIIGALFIPMLALTLLVLNHKSKLINSQYRNHPVTTAILVLILVFFLMAVGLTIKKVLGL